MFTVDYSPYPSIYRFSQDVRYLLPHVEDVLKEEAERQKWETMVVERK